jgi:hypothetical protein
MCALRNTATALLLLVSLSVLGDEVRQVSMRVEPPQAMSALTLAAGGVNVSVPVRNGKALVPVDLPMPWVVAMSRFESSPFTVDDLRLGRPLVVRELGVVAGKVVAAGRPMTGGFSLLLRRNMTPALDERRFEGTAVHDGSFQTRVPAGTYAIAVDGETCATRVRAGVVVRPGATTDLQQLPCEPTSSVSFRVVDGKTKAAVAGANVVWDPLPIFNAADSRVLFSRRWSTVTDKRGVAALRVGPMPIPVRWRVEAAGYALEHTASSELHEPANLTLRDVSLRVKTALHVRVHLPSESDALRGGYLVFGEIMDDQTRRYRARQRFPLGEDVAIELDSYGDRRFSLADRNGRVLFYQDVRIEPETNVIDLSPRPAIIHGRVTRSDGDPVARAAVINGDPRDAHLVLSDTTTDSNGSYSMTTWQRGDLLIYVNPPSSPGNEAGSVSKRVRAEGDDPSYEVNFEMPAGGASLAVVDAATSEPVRARIDAQIKDEQTAHVRMLNASTDENGKLVFTGWPKGEAQLNVSATGYRSARVTLPLRADSDQAETMRLEKSSPLKGRVINPKGLPISHALISAAYDDALGLMPRFEKATDGDGHFQFDSPPESGTLFYVIASGYALSVVTLDSTRENLVSLSEPGRAIAYLTVNNALPTKIYRVVAAPRGESMIPIGVLHDLAEVNGMDEYQLLGSHHDGAVVLPEFLAPGAYDFFITRREGTTFVYDRAGSLVLPLSQTAVLNVKQAP